MRAVIMAAGVGSRISRHINNAPKCTLDIGNISIIENTISILNKFGIYDIAIVLGYKAKFIINLLKNYNVNIFINPFYKITNSIASLWFAREFINKDDDCILLNADVYFEENLIRQVIDEKLDPVLFVDRSRALCGDYKFKYENNILIKFGKELSPEDSTGEYIGIAKISRNFINDFLERMDLLIENQKFDYWWENILYSFSEVRNIYVKDVEGKFWGEVDYLEDYMRILEHRNVNNILLKSL